jgi:hypothetical protein
MTQATAPSRPAPPPARRANGTATAASKSFGFSKPAAKRTGRIVMLYGPGGIGKTTLMATAPGPVRVFDLDGSLPQLADQLGELDVRAIDGVETFQDVRDALHADIWDGVGSIGIDSLTRFEELVKQHLVDNVPHQQGKQVKRWSDHGWNGTRMIYDEFVKLWADFQTHVRAGRNIILVCHDEVTKYINPQGENYPRSEPRLLNDDKGNVRMWAKEQCSEVLFVSYDVEVQKGKGKGSATRSIWPIELPHCLAKNRCGLTDRIDFEKFDTGIWDLIFKAPEAD